MAVRWAVFDPDNPWRRIMFGSEDQARGFAEQNPAWEPISDEDEKWLPLPGEPGWKGWARPVR